jgi:hypothetical protein
MGMKISISQKCPSHISHLASEAQHTEVIKIRQFQISENTGLPWIFIFSGFNVQVIALPLAICLLALCCPFAPAPEPGQEKKMKLKFRSANFVPS